MNRLSHRQEADMEVEDLGERWEVKVSHQLLCYLPSLGRTGMNMETSPVIGVHNFWDRNRYRCLMWGR